MNEQEQRPKSRRRQGDRTRHHATAHTDDARRQTELSSRRKSAKRKQRDHEADSSSKKRRKRANPSSATAEPAHQHQERHISRTPTIYRNKLLSLQDLALEAAQRHFLIYSTLRFVPSFVCDTLLKRHLCGRRECTLQELRCVVSQEANITRLVLGQSCCNRVGLALAFQLPCLRTLEATHASQLTPTDVKCAIRKSRNRGKSRSPPVRELVMDGPCPETSTCLVASLPGLRRLVVRAATADLALLPNACLQGLESLQLEQCSIRSIPPTMPSLRHLAVADSSGTSKIRDLSVFAPRLQHLDLSVDDSEILNSIISESLSLRRVRLAGQSVTFKTLRRLLSDATIDLELFDCCNLDCTAKGLQAILSCCPNLSRLALISTGISSSAVRILLTQRRLTLLDVSLNPTFKSKRLVKALAGNEELLPQLRYLNLSCTVVCKPAHVKRLSNLRPELHIETDDMT